MTFLNHGKDGKSSMICSDWYLAFNTRVVSATSAAFFETPELPPPTVSVTILNKIDKPGRAFARPSVNETSKLALKELAIFIQLTGRMRGSKSVTDCLRWRLLPSHERTFLPSAVCVFPLCSYYPGLCLLKGNSQTIRRHIFIVLTSF